MNSANTINYSQVRLDRQKLASKFNSVFHFIRRGKIYDRQVEHKEREAELKFFNGKGEAIIVYRDDEKEIWHCVPFESLKVLEVK